MVKFDFSDEGIVRIGTHYDHKDRCIAVPGGRWVPRLRMWEYVLTPATASSILQSFSNEIGENDRQKLQNIASRLSLARSVVNGDCELKIPITNTECWHHQLISYNMVRVLFGLDDIHDYSSSAGALLALDMGCGKTKVAIDLICNYPNKISKVLVVCPHSVIEVWTGNKEIKGQFEKHATPQAYKNLVIIPVKGTDLTKKTKFAELARYNAMHQGKQFVAVVNYECVWREPFASWVKDVGFDLVIDDEGHRIKSPGGKASKFFAMLARATKNRLELSGTPMPHSPLDIYGQYRFLDPGIFGTSFTKFRNDYAIVDPRTRKVGHIDDEGNLQEKNVSFGVVLGFRNADQLHDKMFLIAHRVMSKDVFDLPPFQSEIRTCELNGEERRMYEQMDKDFCVEVKDGLVTASNALVKLLRLQEITSGYLDKMPIGSSKRKLLADVLEDFAVREPLVIFARFTNDLKAIKEVVESQGRTYCELSGNVNELSTWQSGKCDVIGVQIQSGKEGVDFTRARYSIYYSLGFSLGDYEQSIKRVDRPGQLRAGMYIHLLAKDTVDFKVMDALKKKQEVIAAVLKKYKEDVPEFFDDSPDAMPMVSTTPH